MQVLIPIKEPKVGMKVEVVKNNCCSIMKKGDGGTIIELTGYYDFKVKDWADRVFECCIQCCREIKETL